MKTYRIIIEAQLPDNYNESSIDNSISDVIYRNNGEVIDIKEYEDLTEII